MLATGGEEQATLSEMTTDSEAATQLDDAADEVEDAGVRAATDEEEFSPNDAHWTNSCT